MTLLAVVMLGAGVLLIASSLDNTPIIQTFQKIVSGQPIDWTGMAGVTTTPPTGTPPPVLPGQVPPGTIPK